MATDAEAIRRGFRIMIVDSDATSLTLTSMMLRKQSYTVTVSELATDAIDIVKNRANELDLILTEARLPDMDGCELLEIIKKISSLPVVVLSAEYDESAMLGSLLRGAEFYLVKPISSDDAKRLWQFSYAKKRGVTRTPSNPESLNQDVTEGTNSSHQEESPEEHKPSEASERESYSTTDGPSDGNGDGNMTEKPVEDNGILTISRKPKLVWTSELQRRFLGAVWLLGIDEAQPKKILKLMKVPGLTKENISSHLQKHRLLVRQQREAKKTMITNSQHPSSSSDRAGTSSHHFLNPQHLMSTHQPGRPISMPGFVSGNFPVDAIDKNLNDPMCIPGFDSGFFPANVDSNQSYLPIVESEPFPPQSYHQPYCNPDGSRAITCGDSAGLRQIGNIYPPGFLMQRPTSLPTAIPHSSTCTGNSLQHQFQMPQLPPLHLPPPLQQQESFTQLGNYSSQELLMTSTGINYQQQQFQTPKLPPPSQDQQETNELFNVEGVGIEDLFDLLNKPTQQPGEEGNHDNPNDHFHSGFESTGIDIDEDFAFP